MRDNPAAPGFLTPGLLALIAILALSRTGEASPSSLLRQSLEKFHSDKSLESEEKLWNPLSGRPVVTADVPETEPNDSLAQADSLSCGDDYRPAAIGVPNDIDIMVIRANTGDRLTFGTDADGTGPQVGDSFIGLFDSTGTLLDSDDDSGPGLYSLISDFPAPYTGIYYLAVIAYDPNVTGAYRAFLRCVPAPPAPPNDTCAGAVRLDCKSVSVTGTTTGAADDYTPALPGTGGCTGYAADGADVVFLVLLPAGGSLSLDYTAQADGSIYLLNACVSPGDAACVAGADNTFSGETEHLSYANVSATGQTYYLVLDSFGPGSSGLFTLQGTLACPPVAVEGLSWGTLKARFGR